jgi:uncharacterized protein (TIGR03663 family)
MDKRRYSARADIGASTPMRRDRTAVPWLDRTFEMARLNWEVVAFAAIMAITVLTRLIDLGSRAMHHDESIHAYFSNYFLRSGDYTVDLVSPGPGQRDTGGGYDPTYHGPFLYHITGLGFYLFGVTEAISRLMPALFGIALVALCWWLRPFIGRWGAIIAALLVAISPSITYYSRSLRHDIFALFGIMLLFVSILWFMRTHEPKWVYLGALGLAVAYTSHELTFIVAFIFVLFLILAAFLYQPVADRMRYDDPRAVPDDVNPVRAAWTALLKQRWTLIGAVLLFLAVYAVLFTSLFTKPGLILSGIVEGFNYWFLQHNEARGNQPVFYYLLIMLLEEPLIFFAGIGTTIYALVRWIAGRPDRLAEGDETDADTPTYTDRYGVPLPMVEGLRGLTLAFLIFWSIGAFIAFSIAGEKMPWLTMQSALPFSLLTAAGFGRLLGRMEWRQVLRGGGIFLGVAVILFIFAAAALLFFLNPNGAMPAPTGVNAELQRGMRSVLLFLVTAGLLGLSGWLAYKLMPLRALKVVGLTFALVLLGYTTRSMVLSSFQYGDVPVTMLVYTQSSPDVPIVADLIKRLSRDETAFDGRSATDVTGGRSLEISIDQTESITWPFDWYFREMKNYKYFNADQWAQVQPGAGQSVVSPNVAVILASSATEANAEFQNFIRDKYTTQRYVLNWWFPESAYKKTEQFTTAQGLPQTREVGDLGTAWRWFTGNAWKYVLYRNPGLPLGSRDFYLHVRNDLAQKAGLLPAGTPSGSPNPNVDPNAPAAGIFDLKEGTNRGEFTLPRGLARDTAGNFYVVDTSNQRVQKFDPTGKFVSIIGNGRGSSDGQFNPLVLESGDARGTGPGGVAVDSAGNVYVADTWNHRVLKFGPAGNFLKSWGGFIDLGDPAAANDGAKDSKFYGPRGVAIGPGDTVYVTDTGNKRVLIYNSDGTYLKQISSGMSATRKLPDYPFTQPGELNEPIGIAVDAGGNVYVADTLNRRIQKFNASGASAGVWPVPGENWGPGEFLEPFLALDADGSNLYVTAPTGKKVLKFNTATGAVAGEKTTEGAISLQLPTGIEVTEDGTIYVVDTNAPGVVNFGKIP